jgi:CHAT domain-containing protein/Tfp pilus assembly protein PilF
MVSARSIVGDLGVACRRKGWLTKAFAASCLLTLLLLTKPAMSQRDEAALLQAKVEQFYQVGKFSEAVPLAQRSLAIYEKTYGPDHINVAGALSNLAILYQAQGRLADAGPLYRRSLAIAERVLGPDNPELATALNNLATLDDDQGRYADAETLYRRSLVIREKALGPNHRLVAASLNNLAVLYKRLARYADAEPLFKRALAIDEKVTGPDSPDVARALDNLALLYQAQARYAEAEQQSKRALAIREKKLGLEDPSVAVSLTNLGALYTAEGRYADAEPLLQRALTIREKTLGSSNLELASSLGTLAALYLKQGRYPEAEPLYDRSLAIFEKAVGPNHFEVAVTLNELAVISQAQRRFADAKSLLERAVAITEMAFGPEHRETASMLNNLAALYEAQGRYADAEPLFKRSLSILEKGLGSEHPNVARSLNNLAFLYARQGRYADALPLVAETIAHGRANPVVALPILFFAQRRGLVSADKARDDALNVAQRAFRLTAAAAVNKFAVRLAAGNGRLAELVRKDQDLAAEADLLDKAILAAVSKEPARRDVVTEQRIKDRLATIAKEHAGLQQVFMREFPDYAALSDRPPLSVQDIQALLSDDEALLLYAAGDEASSFVFAVTRAGATWQRIALGGETLSTKIAAFRRGLNVEAVGGAGPLFDLDVSYELYAGLVGPVEEQVKNAKRLIIVPSGVLTSLPFHLLVTQKASKKAIANDIASYREAAWLIKRQAVSIMPAVANLSALRRGASRERAAKPLVGFGDPVFDPDRDIRDSKVAAENARNLSRAAYTDFWQGAGIDRNRLSQNLARLPDTADELMAVAQSVGAPTDDVHLGRDASETTVKRAPLADYRIVYFATHGLVAGDVKGLAEPSLVLSIPKQPTELDDGLLTASEVAQLKLNADWVVLSACNTIAGDKPGAEALSGLARAFFYAGARALLVSHWSVDSAAATRLTTSTFGVLKNDPKLGRAEALRRAMLDYLNDNVSPINAYPAFWAPFALIGEGAAR